MVTVKEAKNALDRIIEKSSLLSIIINVKRHKKAMTPMCYEKILRLK